MSLYQQTEDLERLVMSPVKATALGKEAESLPVLAWPCSWNQVELLSGITASSHQQEWQAATSLKDCVYKAGLKAY